MVQSASFVCSRSTTFHVVNGKLMLGVTKKSLDKVTKIVKQSSKQKKNINERVEKHGRGGERRNKEKMNYNKTIKKNLVT